MPRPSLIERARSYVATMPPGISGQGRHNATVAVANVLLHGFALRDDDAWALLMEYNQRCQPPSDEKKLQHRFEVARKFSNDKADGWLADGVGEYGKLENAKPPPPRPMSVPPQYNLDTLKRTSGEWASTVNLVWLANRSPIEPALTTARDFLEHLYPLEKILIFNECSNTGSQITQGEALWPSDPVPTTGKWGVWFLPQPVDGQYHPKPGGEKDGESKMSRRSKESVVAFRYLVIESDTAPVREWLGVVAQLPLPLTALYTSGGRSVHALVRIDARTKDEWDECKAAWFGKTSPGGRFLIQNGMDAGVLSAVRLTRLPGAMREGKLSEDASGRKSYERFATPRLQKLLYLNPDPDDTPLIDSFPRRDVEGYWLAAASAGISDADETGGQWLRDGLRYYSPVSAAIRASLTKLETAA